MYVIEHFPNDIIGVQMIEFNVSSAECFKYCGIVFSQVMAELVQRKQLAQLWLINPNRKPIYSFNKINIIIAFKYVNSQWIYWMTNQRRFRISLGIWSLLSSFFWACSWLTKYSIPQGWADSTLILSNILTNKRFLVFSWLPLKTIVVTKSTK